jgi:hypothetical protein
MKRGRVVAVAVGALVVFASGLTSAQGATVSRTSSLITYNGSDAVQPGEQVHLQEEIAGVVISSSETMSSPDCLGGGGAPVFCDLAPSIVVNLFSGDDTLTLQPGSAFGATAMTVNPGPGVDSVTTGGAADTTNARDGAIDTISCGAGADTAIVDANDAVSSDCETVQIPAAADGDGDGVPDPSDACPTQAGTGADGCPAIDAAACDKAKAKLKRAKAKLKKLKASDAPKAKIAKAKKRVKQAKKAVKAACAPA